MNDQTNTPFRGSSNGSGTSESASAEAHDGTSPTGIVDTLESIVVNLERLIDGRSREELQQAAQDGGWGIVEILSHLQDWEEVAHERVRSILEESRPQLEDYDDTLWAIEHDYRSQNGHVVFACIAELRHDLVDRLRQLNDADWRRPAILAGHGEITLHWLMQNLVKHDMKHLGQAREVFG